MTRSILALDRPLIDEVLVDWDAAIGFHWPDFVAAMAQWPIVVAILHGAYASTLSQIALLLIILGLSGRTDVLHRFVLALMIAAVLTVGFWMVFPSMGANSPLTKSRLTDSMMTLGFDRG